MSYGSKTTYAYTTGTLGTATATQTLTYSTGAWGDQLTGTTYDAVGNPLTYNGFAMTWSGRQLKSMVKNGGQYSYSFTYNDEGIRTSKTSQGVKHTYILEGSRIVGEQFGVHLLLYLYDESGAPIGLQYRSTSYNAGVFDTYYFEKNVFGDIVGIYTADGTRIGAYKYDAWGVCTATVVSGITTLQRNIVTTYNPFRYRGYYYDKEIQLYYLQSRYYDPATGRFINADNYVNANGDLLGYNMYAYCGNNPVMNTDPSGEFALTALLVGAAIGGLVSFLCAVAAETAEQAIDPSDEFDWGDVLISTGIGMAEGALTALVPGASGLISAGGSALDSFIDGIRDGNSTSEIVIDTLWSGAIGYAGGSWGSDIRKGGELVKDAAASFSNAVRKGVHPKVKKIAQKTVKKAGKYVAKSIGSGIVSDFAYGGIYEFSSWFTNAAYNHSVRRLYS